MKHDKASFLQIDDKVSLYYEEHGSGTPLILIPGWSMSHQVFAKQIAFFSKNYRVIAFDPRGQGLSSSTQEHNNYTQHGKDLAQLIDALELKNVILVAWSWGSFDAYAYMRLKGVNNIKAFVGIDTPPTTDNKICEWQARASLKNKTSIESQLIQDRLNFTPTWIQGMLEQPLTAKELEIFVSAALKTKTQVALDLLSDALRADYRNEVIALEQARTPTLYVVAKSMKEGAERWLKTNAPHAKLEVVGEKHMMFWDHAEDFNQRLADFLKNHK